MKHPEHQAAIDDAVAREEQTIHRRKAKKQFVLEITLDYGHPIRPGLTSQTWTQRYETKRGREQAMNRFNRKKWMDWKYSARVVDGDE